MKITVKLIKSYGAEYIYPVCSKALAFTRLLDQKILTRRDLSWIKDLGYEIEIHKGDAAPNTINHNQEHTTCL